MEAVGCCHADDDPCRPPLRQVGVAAEAQLLPESDSAVATCHAPLCHNPLLRRNRPLELRQPFVFYLGHLPAFADARLARVLQQPLTEPVHFADMFARGIDPDLDDPTQCECLC